MKKVMIVDDSDTLRDQLSKLLVNAGFDVIAAANGIAGVELWKTQGEQVNVIVTDYNMPEMDGIAMVKKIRTIGRGTEVPILMLTTESSPELKAVGKEVGVRAWVTKPFSEEKLIQALNKIVG